MKKLLSIIGIGAMLSNYQSFNMPEVDKKYKFDSEREVFCKSILKPDVYLRWYNSNGDPIALTATRIGSDNPYIIVVDNGMVYYDNGSNKGIAEDGLVDKIKNLRVENDDSSVCDDMPNIKDT